MTLVIGGYYQGKLDYVLSNFNVCNDDILDCSSIILDFNNCFMKNINEKKVIYNLDKFILDIIDEEKNIVALFESNMGVFQDKIIIVNDISSGIVPIDEKLRLWREEVGRILNVLSRNANSVVRVFCGIGTVIK